MQRLVNAGDAHNSAALEFVLVEKSLPLVSVIIPTRAGPSCATVESLMAQTYPNIEVIVVAEGRERSEQANRGASLATGDYVYRVDDDFVLEPNVVSEAVTTCLKGYDGVVIHNESEPTVSRWAKVRHVERECYRDDAGSEFSKFVSRSAFFSVGGFDCNLFAEEDRDFHDRLLSSGYRIGRISAKETHTGEPSSLAEVVRKQVYYGPSFAAYFRKSGLKATLRLGPFRRCFIRHWREIAADPRVLCGFIVYQWVRYLSACAGFLLLSSSSRPNLWPNSSIQRISRLKVQGLKAYTFSATRPPGGGKAHIRTKDPSRP